MVSIVKSTRRAVFVTKSVLAAKRSGYRLPPGQFDRLERLEKLDRHVILEKAKRFGSVFKSIWYQRLVICITDLPTSLRFLRDHADDLRPISLDLKALFPKGFIRTMEGETHRRYRGVLMKAIGGQLASVDEADLRAIIADALRDLSSNQDNGDLTPEALARTLKQIAVGLLIRLLLDVDQKSPLHADLVRKYQAISPEWFVWRVGEKQKIAFEAIRSAMTSHLSATGRSGASRPLRDALQSPESQGIVDETALGNLIYMVEMGRYDIFGFFRWMIKDLAENQDCLTRLSGLTGSKENQDLANNFVQEALRMDQSERMIRRVERGFNWDGFHIPKGAYVRLSLWEPHKDPDVFEEPFVFDMDRFAGKSYSLDQYAPFGLDHHKCLAAQIVAKLGTLFVQELAAGYGLSLVSDGPPVRQHEIWEPNPKLSVHLSPRSAVARRASAANPLG